MCIAIFPLSETDSINIEFALERIYQRRNGGTVIWLDILVRNNGGSAVDRLRMLIPHSLVDVSKTTKMTPHRAGAALERLRQQQVTRVQLKTLDLAAPDYPSNWPYGLLQHVSLDSQSWRPGVFTIRRKDHLQGKETLDGFIKQGWQIESPDGREFDNHAWLLYASNGLCLFDLASRGSSLERLMPQEAMWLRIECQMPPIGFNRKSLLERVFGRVSKHVQLIKSPSRLCRDAAGQLKRCKPADHRQWQPAIAAAQMTAVRHLPEHCTSVEIKDWRTFLYREYGLELKAPEHGGSPVKKPNVTNIFRLPPAADPPGCRRFPMPIWMNWLARNMSREDSAYEFFFGTEFEKKSDSERKKRGQVSDDYHCETTVESGNSLYIYLEWLSFLIAVIALVLAIVK